MLIILLLISLLVGILVVCLCNDKLVKHGALIVSLCCFFLSTVLFGDFDNYSSFQHLYISE